MLPWLADKTLKFVDKTYCPSQSVSLHNLRQADLICIRELLERDKEWDFYMNPAASELPLMAVGEIEDLVREGTVKISDRKIRCELMHICLNMSANIISNRREWWLWPPLLFWLKFAWSGVGESIVDNYATGRRFGFRHRMTSSLIRL